MVGTTPDWRSSSLRRILRPSVRVIKGARRRATAIASGLVLFGALLGATASGSPTSMAAGASSPLTTQLDNALQASLTQSGAPGAQGAIFRCGSEVWSGAKGTTVVSGSQPVTPTTRFILASTTKTITATMVMKLIQDKKLIPNKPDPLTLDTRLSTFYPSLRNSQTITIRMLLNNTSGLPHYEDNDVIAPLISDPNHSWTPDQIVAALAKANPEAEPGKGTYNNANWVVLAGIIPQVAGMSLNAYFKQAIADPAGMTQSTFAYQPSLSSEFAHPYEKVDGALTDKYVPGVGIPSNYWGETWGDGGLASTAFDLAKFSSALFGDKLVSRSSLNEMMTLVGKERYGLGMTVYEDGDHTWYGHAGSYGGYESENWTYTADRLTITVTADLGGAKGIWAAVAHAYAESKGAAAPCG